MKKLLLPLCVLTMLCASLSAKPKREVIYPVTFDIIAGFIENLGFTHETITTTENSSEINTRISMDIRGENGSYSVYVELFTDIDVIYIYVEKYLDLPLDDPATVPMLTYLMNQNWHLTFGRIEWNMSSGEVRLSHTLHVDDGISQEVLGAYLTSIISIADEKLPDYLITLESFKNF